MLNDRKTFDMLKRAVKRQGDHALAVDCHHCGAPPGKPCMSPLFRPTKTAHVRRLQVAYALRLKARKP